MLRIHGPTPGGGGSAGRRGEGGSPYGKQAADDRVERSLYQRANGYLHRAVKVFMRRDGTTVEHKYIEHYPPDPTSMCFWLKNRRPDRWRDVQNIDHAVGVYHISEAPMTRRIGLGRRRTASSSTRTFPSASQNRVMLLALVNPGKHRI